MKILASTLFAVVAVLAHGYNSESEATNSTTPTNPACDHAYTVKHGDTLNEIAAQHGTTTAKIGHKNPQITNINQIEKDQTICIPAKQQPTQNQPDGGHTKTSPTSTTETIWVPATDGPKGSETLQPPENVRNAIVKHFGDLGAKRVQQALMISRCESTYRNAHRGITPTTGDYGIMQINYLHAKPGELLPKMGLTLNQILNSPDLNAQIARKLYDRRANRGQPVWEDWKQSRHCHNQQH